MFSSVLICSIDIVLFITKTKQSCDTFRKSELSVVKWVDSGSCSKSHWANKRSQTCVQRSPLGNGKVIIIYRVTAIYRAVINRFDCIYKYITTYQVSPYRSPEK